MPDSGNTLLFSARDIHGTHLSDTGEGGGLAHASTRLGGESLGMVSAPTWLMRAALVLPSSESNGSAPAQSCSGFHVAQRLHWRYSQVVMDRVGSSRSAVSPGRSRSMALQESWARIRSWRG